VILLLLIALGACLASFGLASAGDAQQPGSPKRIGVLLATFSPESKEVQAFRQGLRDAGYDEGRDIVIEWRYAKGDYDRVSELAAELVQRKVDLIVVDSTPGTHAVKRATSTIPIVMTSVADPVGSGLVANLAHPGGNVTGLSLMSDELAVKRLELLKETIPRLTRVAVLPNPANPWHTKAVAYLKAAAPSLSIELSIVGMRMPEEIGPAFSAVRRTHAQAVYVTGNGLSLSNRAMLIKLASIARLPTIYWARHFADEGGLMSYGPNFVDSYRRSAGYVDKILKGAKPGELPIEQPAELEFIVNLKTAKALGLTIPESILLRATEVIR
jgi:putative ABC transport system substrate-binding protein